MYVCMSVRLSVSLSISLFLSLVRVCVLAHLVGNQCSFGWGWFDGRLLLYHSARTQTQILALRHKRLVGRPAFHHFVVHFVVQALT